jgi:hypothetical protein
MKYAIDSEQVRIGDKSLRIDYTFRDNRNQFIAFITKDMGASQNWSQYDGISLWSYVPKKTVDLRELSIVIYEEDGAGYVAQHVRSFKKTGWEESSAPFSSFVFSSGPPSHDKGAPLNLQKIRKIAVGIYQPVACADKSFTLWVDNVALFGAVRPDKSTGPDTTVTATDQSKSSPIVDPLTTKLSGWSTNCSDNTRLDYSIDSSVTRQGNKSLKMKYSFKNDKKLFWGYVDKNLGSARDWSGYDSISFSSYIPTAAKDLIELSVMLYEEDGSAYITQHVRGLKTTGWEQATVPFSKFHIAGEWTKDENSDLDPDQIKKVSIGIFQPTKFSEKEFTIYVSDIRAAKSKPDGPKTDKTTPVLRKNELQKFEPPDGKVYHAAFAFSAPMKGWGADRQDWEKQMDAKQILEYERLSGRPLAMASFFWFLDWDFPKRICDDIRSLNKTPHLGVIVGGISTSDIAKGKADNKLREWARAAKAYKNPIFFRFLPEMNGNWHLYSEAHDPAQTHQKYVEAWRHAVNVFKQVGADNIVWVWAPTSISVGKIHWKDYYPGDDYVDWVGVSVYSFLGNGDPEPQIMGIYNDYAERKPIIIAECASGDADSNAKSYKPGKSYYDNPVMWINRFFDTIENKASRVKAFVWFNIDRERVWKIQESTDKTKIFKDRLSNKRYDARIGLK